MTGPRFDVIRTNSFVAKIRRRDRCARHAYAVLVRQRFPDSDRDLIWVTEAHFRVALADDRVTTREPLSWSVMFARGGLESAVDLHDVPATVRRLARRTLRDIIPTHLHAKERAPCSSASSPSASHRPLRSDTSRGSSAASPTMSPQ